MPAKRALGEFCAARGGRRAARPLRARCCTPKRQSADQSAPAPARVRGASWTTPTSTEHRQPGGAHCRLRVQGIRTTTSSSGSTRGSSRTATARGGGVHLAAHDGDGLRTDGAHRDARRDARAALALRGGDGALHDAVKGMRRTSAASSSSSSRSSLQARASALHRARAPPPTPSPHPPAARGSRRSRSPSATRRWAPSRAAPSPLRRPLARRDDRSTFFTLAKFRLPKARRRAPGAPGAIRLGAAAVMRASLRRLRARARAAITGEFTPLTTAASPAALTSRTPTAPPRRRVRRDAIAGDDGRLLTAESLDAAMAAALRDERGGGYDGRLRRAGGEEEDDDDDEGVALRGRRRGGGARNGGGGAGSALLGGRSGARSGGGRPARRAVGRGGEGAEAARARQHGAQHVLRRRRRARRIPDRRDDRRVSRTRPRISR